MNKSIGTVGLVTAIGAILAIIGLFSPTLNISGIETVSYADVADTDAYIITALAAIVVIVLLLGKARLALLKNIGGGDDSLMGDIKDIVSDPAQKMAEEVTEKLFTNVLDLEWGGFALLIGMLVMLVGSVVVFGKR